MGSYCLAGKTAIVNLSNRRIEIFSTADFGDEFWGGRGLNQKILLDMEPRGISSFDPNSIIIIGAGRLVGTDSPGAVRTNIDGKNVFTGGIGSSNIGGMFGRKLKRNGFDHIVVTGESLVPIYLLIREGTITIADAKELWGCTLSQTNQKLHTLSAYTKAEFLAIGPAGENEVWTSAILDKRGRAAGRCGLGAIWGRKKLKAVVVASRGCNSIAVADKDSFRKIRKILWKKLADIPAVQRKKKYGTVAALTALNSVSAMPFKNFEHEHIPENNFKPFNSKTYMEITKASINSCSACPIRCQHLYLKNDNDPINSKMEINSVWGFGTRLGIQNPQDLLRCNSLCSQYGLDVDGTTAALCWVFDCYEKGILKDAETEGLSLEWGNTYAVEKLLKMIAYKNNGIGELVAKGTLNAAKKLGRNSEKLVFHVKGQDVVEPIRSCKGWALGIAVSPRGATHTRGAPQTEFHKIPDSVSQKLFDVNGGGNPSRYLDKEHIVLYYEKLHAALDSLGICHFVSNWSAPDLLGPEEFTDICNAAMDEGLNIDSFMFRGEKIMSLEKIYNMMNTKFGREDDYLPEYFMEKGLQNGPMKNEKIRQAEWDAMLDRYYSLHGWNRKTTFPQEKTLKRLGLDEYLKYLEK